MKYSKVMTGLMSVVALMAIVAGASNAATPGRFGFSTVFSPNTIHSSDPSTYVTVQDNTTLINKAPTKINLCNFTEMVSSDDPSFSASDSPDATILKPFTLDLSVTPDGGTTQTQKFTGVYTDTLINAIQTSADVKLNGPSSLTYDFGNQGVYIFNNVTFSSPGNSFSETNGSLSASVTYAAAVPEPASIAPFVMGGIGLMGLAFRARKAKVTGSRAA